MKNIIFIAPPASGKGTLSDMLKDKYNYAHISTGDLLREAKDNNSSLGGKISEIMNSGALVPDDIVLELLRNRMMELKNDDLFILDGYPRNINQIQPLIDIFKELNVNNYVVIYLDVDFDKAMKRTLGRLTCPKCHKGYNEFFEDLKPKVNNICDSCGTSLIKRSDDNEATFKIRYDTYINETKQVVDYFKDIHKLEVIDASLSPQVILSNVERIIN